MPSPSNLPDFVKLAKKLAYSSGLVLEKSEPIDRFLGRLSKKNANDPYAIHKNTISILSDSSSSYNELHSGILNLFKNKVRLVTTNFDNHLSSALKALNKETLIYKAPALPLGEDFYGIVHLHGCIDQDPSCIVLTDEDFGKAYLTKGWATRFLLDLFNNYTVLFIGYSHNDTVLNYLARGLPSSNLDNRFAIVEKGKDLKHWEHLGIRTTEYELVDNAENSHENLIKLINAWADWTNCNLLDEEKRIKNIVENVKEKGFQSIDPIDKDYLIEDVFTQFYKLKFFTQFAGNSLEWLKWADENGLLKNIFEEDHECNKEESHIIEWVINSFVYDENLYVESGLSLVDEEYVRQEEGLLLNNLSC